MDRRGGRVGCPGEPTVFSSLDQPRRGSNRGDEQASAPHGEHVRVLIVDDDPDFRQFLELALEGAGTESTAAPDGEQALQALRDAPGGHYDLILLDIEMPGQDGFELLYALRETGREIPVIFVTGREKVADRVRGLELGADDYLIKPVAAEELVARIETVVRRREQVAPLEYGELSLDLARHRVQRNGAPVELSPREFDLLLALVRAKGEIVSRDDLLRDIWNIDFDPSTNVLDVHIGRLRKKLDRHGRPLIKNERGQGFFIAAYQSEEN